MDQYLEELLILIITNMLAIYKSFNASFEMSNETFVRNLGEHGGQAKPGGG